MITGIIIGAVGVVIGLSAFGVGIGSHKNLKKNKEKQDVLNAAIIRHEAHIEGPESANRLAEKAHVERHLKRQGKKYAKINERQELINELVKNGTK